MTCAIRKCHCNIIRADCVLFYYGTNYINMKTTIRQFVALVLVGSRASIQLLASLQPSVNTKMKQLSHHHPPICLPALAADNCLQQKRITRGFKGSHDFITFL